MGRLAGVLCLLLALALPSSALAARQPTRPERQAITRVMSGKSVPRACFPLNITVSTRNSRYAVASYRSGDKCGVVMGNGESIVKRIGYRRWRVVETGSSLACNGGLVPRAVMKDLIDGRCEP
jgi:hypothetical protein